MRTLFKLRIFRLFLLIAAVGSWGHANCQETEVGVSSTRGAIAVDSDLSGRRYALVIGNSAYAHAPALPNGVNDATAIARSLRNERFEVLLKLDVTLDTLEDAVEEFSRKLQPGDVSLFYYAGHGLQANGANYLIPVDAAIERPADLSIEALRLDDVIEAMTAEDNTAIVLLDACRNSPFTRNLQLSKKSRSIGLGRGLAPVDAGRGVYIGFATQPDNVALDGDTDHSPFAAALLRHMPTADIDIEILMRRVRADVMEATGQQQVPWSNSSLVEPGFAFRPDRAGQKANTQRLGPATGSDAADLEFWQSVKNTSDVNMLRAYLAAFPAGTFRELAEDRIAKLEKPGVLKKTPALTTKKPNTTTPGQTQKPVQTRSSGSQPTPATTGGRCRDGNITRCRENCRAGRKGACDMLRRLE
jgi:hypothetical protein